MPARARALAAERLIALRDHAERSAVTKGKPGVIANISNLIIELQLESDHIYRKSIGPFMTFTNDLDRSRGQRFQDVCPELHELIVSDGQTWDESLRYANV
jgi:hypothetical protein